jgi:AraC family transcriptional regulator
MRPNLEARIKQAMRYIVDNLDVPIDLREHADHVCLSRFHFHRVFEALAGETVGEVVRRQRLERAATRLRTSDALRRLYDRAAGSASYRDLRCGTNGHRMIK